MMNADGPILRQALDERVWTSFRCPNLGLSERRGYEIPHGKSSFMQMDVIISGDGSCPP